MATENKKIWRFFKSRRGQPTVVWDEKKKKVLARLPARPGDEPLTTTSKKLADKLISLGYTEEPFTYDRYMASDRQPGRNLRGGSTASETEFDSTLSPPKEVDLDKIPREAAELLRKG